MHTCEKIVQNYLLADNFENTNFKSNPNYTYMLEHVNYAQGNDYLHLIKTEFEKIFNPHKTKLIALCNQNDSCGCPKQAQFVDFTTCSPSNLRYIYHSLLILNFLKSKNNNKVDFVEIGGGYGGLSFFLHNLSALFDIKINSYTIFDLKNICKFQEKYLEHFHIDIKTAVLGTDFNLSNDSFLISNYAFSEISATIRNKYTTEVIDKYIDMGFMAWNNIDFYKFIADKKFIVEEERPKTGPKNLYVYFH